MQLDQFCKYLGDSPNELYAIESVNQDSRESGDKLALRMAFEDFRKHLIENKGLNPNTAKNYKKALNRFLRANGLSELPRDEGKSVEANDVNLIIKDQIRHLLETAGNDYRLRALILTAKDTGLRVSDLAQLTVGYFNGMRIDHFLVSNNLLDKIINIKIDNKPRSKIKPSDHTPIELEIN